MEDPQLLATKIPGLFIRGDHLTSPIAARIRRDLERIDETREGRRLLGLVTLHTVGGNKGHLVLEAATADQFDLAVDPPMDFHGIRAGLERGECVKVPGMRSMQRVPWHGGGYSHKHFGRVAFCGGVNETSVNLPLPRGEALTTWHELSGKPSDVVLFHMLSHGVGMLLGTSMRDLSFRFRLGGDSIEETATLAAEERYRKQRGSD